MSDRAIRSIAIAGGGIVGLSAALAFRRALPQSTVRVIELPADPAAVADRMPTAWPSVHPFHRLIGLEEAQLVRDGIAVHHLGTRFSSWAGRPDWVHAFGPHGKPIGAVQFDQVWVQAHGANRGRPYDHYSPGAVLARAGRFVHPPRNAGSLLGGLSYGLRLDPEPYRARLRNEAARANIGTIEARSVEHVERRADGGLQSLHLGQDERIEADLFVDCSGPAGLLAAQVEDSFEDWPSHAATGLLIEEDPAGELVPAARIRATDEGWIGEWPLRDRIIRCTAGSDLEPAVPLQPGRRTRPWTRNVLAIGDSAAAIDPLHGLNLTLAHRAIFLALELLPGRDFNPLELAEFNRRWCLITDQLRDFIALHYLRNGLSGMFWEAAAKADPPAELARRLDQYGYRGRLPFQEDEILNRDDWTAALLGLGLVPRNADPAASGVPRDRAFDAMDTLADELAAFAAAAPAYPDYLERISGAL